MLDHLGINSSDIEFMELKKTEVINTENKETNDGTL